MVTTADSNAPRCAVLIVDDQRMVIEAIRRMLSTEPTIQFEYCIDPKAAVQRALEMRPTLILQDLVMPDMDGLDLLKTYRTHSELSEIPVIVLSSKEDPVVKRDAFASGADDYLVKPPEPIEFVARVKAHSRSYENRVTLRRLHAELAARNAELQRLSVIDGLTGVANRRAFDRRLDELWRHSSAYQTWLSLLMVDVDCFKGYNDQYGHIKGDDCLRKVAQILAASLHHEADFVARYGGEEFAVILPETDIAGAATVAERLRHKVESLLLEHRGSKCASHVTISLGVHSLIPDRVANPEMLVQGADQALYQSKATGRNCVTCANESVLKP